LTTKIKTPKHSLSLKHNQREPIVREKVEPCHLLWSHTTAWAGIANGGLPG
jgi:hypothetical protein